MARSDGVAARIHGNAMREYDVIVVGAGMGGLAASILLAARGKSVLVIDALSEAGGKMGRHTIDGVVFDTGPSMLTMPDVLETVFREANTSNENELTLIPQGQRFDFSDGVALQTHFELKATLAAVQETLGASAEAEFRGFLAYASRVWEAANTHFVYGPAPSFGSVARLGPTAWRQLGAIDPLRSMKSAIQAQVKDPHLQDLLLRYATYNGSDPRHAPATLNCIAWVELGLGGYGVQGGMYQVAAAMHRVALGQGVAFKFNTRVEQIVVNHGAVAGVRVEDADFSCSAVVSNVDVSHLVSDLAPELVPNAKSSTPSMSGWTAVIRARRRDRPAHQVFFSASNYIDEFAQIFDVGGVPNDPCIYVCAQEKAHHITGWDTEEPLFVMVNAPAETGGRTDWVAFESKVLAALVGRGAIALEDTIVWRRTPAELAQTFVGSRGSIYGPASNSRFSAFQRMPNATKIRGLAVAGGGAHPGGGVPLCILSGHAAASFLSRSP